MSRTSKARVLRRIWKNAGHEQTLREFARQAARGEVGDKMLRTQAQTWMRAKRIAPVSS